MNSVQIISKLVQFFYYSQGKYFNFFPYRFNPDRLCPLNQL